MNNNYGGGYNNGGGRGGRGRGRGRGGYGGRGGRGGFNNKRKFDNGDDYNQGYANNKRGRWNSETNYENSESAAESSSNNHAVASTVPEVEIRKNFYSEHPRTAEMTHEEVEKYRSQHNITVESEDCPKFVTEFEYAGFPETVVNNLKEQGFKQPTPIQAQCWPISMQGRDLIGLAETGSGKTLSFLLPAMVHIDAQPRVQGGEGPILLILAPTRELAIQIEAVAQTACKAYAGSIRSTCIYGGVPKGPQIEALATGSEILIATPGRLIDLMEEGHFGLSRVTYLVLDEADRMLDMGFEPQIRQIMKYVTHSQRQTAMYSATWPDDVRKLASEFLSTERVKVNIGSVELAASHQITQIVQVCEEWDKKNMLLSLLKKLHNGKTKIIIFMLYKKACDFLSNFLGRSRYPVACLHGDMSQAQREQQIASFKSGELPILIATDVAARGLDIKDVKYVINYEFPLRIEDYVHRIGRTGRAGEKGTAYTYFTKENKEFSRDLYKILTEAKQQIPDQLEQWKHIGPKTQKQTPMTKLYGKGQWNIREGSESQKKHIKFDD